MHFFRHFVTLIPAVARRLKGHTCWAVIAAAALTGCATPTPQTHLPEANSAPSIKPAETLSSGPSLKIGRTSPVWPNSELRAIEPGQASAATVATLSATTDLWERIRRGFAMPDLQNELVRQQEQWYSARPDYIGRMTERSTKYLFHIVEELERRNMPSELALLPFIESAFNPQAVSQAKAAGMWQFMPATGKDYDLKQNAFRDDRRDVLASTRAALDYLQMLHGMFNDWHLALAAYNWGQGSVKRAIERNEKKGLPTGYEDLTMPTETRMYVPKLQAVKNIVAQPQAFAAQLPVIENHPFFETVAIHRDIDVALAARLAEVDLADFRALNPSLHSPVILAAGTPHILLPWENATVFQRNLQFHLGPLATWTAWAVPSHMRTADIAKRVGMSEEELRSLNKIPPRMLVRAGSTLLVPRANGQGSEVPEHVADNAHVQLQPEVVLVRRTVKARKGDNLAAVATRLGVSVAEMAQWNKLGASATLKAGQTLVAFTPKASAKKPQAKRERSLTSAQPQKAGKRTAVAPATKRKSSATPSKRNSRK